MTCLVINIAHPLGEIDDELITNEQGLKKCIFPSKVVRFRMYFVYISTISYVFLYLKSQNFPSNG